ncbi:MAG: nucleoside hydrolase [Pseudomonadota bacterium]
MKRSLPLSLLLTLFAAGAQAKTPVIFDNDMAIDDWATLLFLAREPSIELIAVTVAGSGEAHCAPGVSNALALLHLADPAMDVPVSCGDEVPLDGYFVFPQAWQDDMDILSGVDVPRSPRSADTRHAVDLMHAAIEESDEPVTILATGPMTNIAQWLRRYPSDRERVERIVIMGGSLDAPGNIIVPEFTDGHPNTLAEWNFFVDPMAADELLRSGVAIEMVGLDVTNTVRVTAEFAATFKQQADNPAARFWDEILDKNDWFIASDEYYFWDVLAALVVIDAERFCSGEQRALAVDVQPAGDKPWLQTSDLSIPPTRWDGADRQHLASATAGAVIAGTGAANTQVCLQTDGPGAFKLFTEVMTGEP